MLGDGRTTVLAANWKLETVDYSLVRLGDGMPLGLAVNWKLGIVAMLEDDRTAA